MKWGQLAIGIPLAAGKQGQVKHFTNDIMLMIQILLKFILLSSKC